MYPRLIAATLLAFVTFGSHAGDFETSQGVENPRDIYLDFTGDIESGDAQKLRSLAMQSRWNFLLYKALAVDSRGGNVSEALRIAEFVELSGLPVLVNDDAVCASSCFFIYVSAPDRAAFGPVIVHRPYFDMGHANGSEAGAYESAYRSAFSGIRDFLHTRLTPDYIIQRMMTRSSVDGYQLTRLDLSAVGPFSPALHEYLLQVCKLPTDRRADAHEIADVRACKLAYIQQTRMKYLFGNDYALAGREYRKIDTFLSNLVKDKSVPKHVFSRTFSAAANAVDTLPPKLWVSRVQAAYEGEN